MKRIQWIDQMNREESLSDFMYVFPESGYKFPFDRNLGVDEWLY